MTGKKIPTSTRTIVWPKRKKKPLPTVRSWIYISAIILTTSFFGSNFPISNSEHPRAVATDEPTKLALRCAGTAATGFVAGGIAAIWTGPGVVPGALLGGAVSAVACTGETLWTILLESL
jgi:lysozyme family protein